MARIPYAEAGAGSPAWQALLRDRPALNLYRMLAHAGGTAEAVLGLGDRLKQPEFLDPRSAELAILRVGHRSGSRYEVHHHRHLARRLGLSTDQIRATEPGGNLDALTPRDRCVLDFTDALVRDPRAPEALFRAVVAELGEGAAAELVLLVGFYMMIARFLETFDVDLET